MALIAATKEKLGEIARVKRKRNRDKVAARVGVVLAKRTEILSSSKD